MYALVKEFLSTGEIGLENKYRIEESSHPPGRANKKRVLSWENDISPNHPMVFCYFESGSHYVVQVGLKLKILLPQPPSAVITDVSIIPSGL
jgi:hypothetical protein